MEKMRSIFLGCALIAGQTTVAGAADMVYPPDKGLIEVPAPMPVPVYGAWYMRGYMGMTNQDVDEITSSVIEEGNFQILSTGFDSSPLWGLGVGYDKGQFRFDLTGEYRGKASFTGLDCYNCGDPVPIGGTNEYTATKSEWLMLANAYWDIGTWKGVTPYVGAGIGWASITIDDFKDINVPNNGIAFAESQSTSNFAWALHAGLAYDVTQNFTLDVGYRYVRLGDAESGVITAYDGSGTFDQLQFKDIDSHDLLLGARWTFGCDCTIPYASKY